MPHDQTEFLEFERLAVIAREMEKALVERRWSSAFASSSDSTEKASLSAATSNEIKRFT